MTHGEGRVVALVGAAAVACAWGQVCEPVWTGDHTTGELDGQISVMFEWPDHFPGSLIAGGRFSLAGGVPTSCVARWDGQRWHAMSMGMSSQGLPADVLAFEVFDLDGQGDSLLAAGQFDEADGAAADNLARWDDDGWVPVPTGADGPINALRVFDPDGDGPSQAMLYVGGDFSQLNGNPTSYIGRWDGESWEPLAVQGDGPVRSLVMLDPDGSGPEPGALYAIGEFVFMDGLYSPGIARFDGVTWHAVPDGALMGFGAKASLYDPDGAGPKTPLIVIAGMDFTGRALLAAFDGAAWTDRIVGEPGCNFGAIAPWEPDGSNADAAGVYVRGEFSLADGASNFVRWIPGAGWQTVGNAEPHSGGALRVSDPDGDGPLSPRLLVAGEFSTERGSYPSIATWDGSSFSRLGRGVLGDAQMFALAEPMPPLAAGVYLHGGMLAFDAFDNPDAVYWNGSAWQVQPWPFSTDRVYLAAWDPDGNGPLNPVTVAGGDFESVEGTPIKRIASWTGTAWEQMGAGIDEPLPGLHAITTIASWDPDGAGPETPRLCIAGGFSSSGGLATTAAAQ